jgi:hypothetical protein
MPFLFTRNLVEKQAFSGNPWEFQCTETITDEIRKTKAVRQAWYKTVETKHCFYTGIEPFNPNTRVSREDNPPKFIWAFCPDFDVKIPDARVEEVIAAMPIKPAYWERSVGGNVRLVFILPRAIPVDNYEFCVFVLQSARKWLNLDLLPGLDEGAWTSPTRLLCNGCEWHETGHGPVSEDALQAFFVECARKFRFKSNADTDVPLETVEKALKEKYADAFQWPGDFVIDSQGPSFWIPASTSPMSAILKRDGIYTFAAHAEGKGFYTWADLLGPDFIKTFSANAIAAATKDIFWDGNNFWRKIAGYWCPLKKDELINYFEVTCGLTTDPGKGKKSHVKIALEHIYTHNRVSNAAPYVFRPPGVLMYLGERRLNTYTSNVMKPADEVTPWGKDGKFSWLSERLDVLFDEKSLHNFLAWWQYYYLSGLNYTPRPGTMIFLMGEVNSGKTLLNREIVGRSVGGFVDVQGYVVHGEGFTEHLYRFPQWCLDDDTISDNSRSHSDVMAKIKKIVANKDVMSNQKFRIAGMTEWHGRLFITTNLDDASRRILGPMDNGTLDKIMLLRARSREDKWESREEIEATIARELPYLLAWLVQYVPPEFVERDSRFGYRPYKDPTLMEQAQQSSRVAPFKELLIDTLRMYLETQPEATELRVTVTQLQRMLSAGPNDVAARSIKLDQINRYLEQVQKEGVINCRVEPGPMGTRIWVFERGTEFGPVLTSESKPPTNENKVSIFSK